MKEVKNLQIGKNKLTNNYIKQIESCFKYSTMVRISVLKSATRDKEECEKMGEQIINKLGTNFTCRLIGHTLIIQKWRKARR